MGIFDFTQAASDPNNPNSIVAPSEVARRQMLADEMMKQGADYSPVQSPWQGAARMAQGLFGGMQSARDTQMTQAGRTNNQSMLAQLLGGFGQPQAAGASGGATPMTDPMAGYRSSIGGMESSNNYGALGPVTGSGDRAYGKYQVMGNNIPDWTKAILGQSETPQQFLADTAGQDKVFNSKFASYLQNGHTPQDAASMWFTGRPQAQGGNASDVLGTTGNQYVAKFNAALPGAPNGQPPNAAMAANAAPQISPAGNQDDGTASPAQGATGAAPTGQQPAPQAQPQMNMQKMLSYLNDPYTSPQMAQVVGQLLQHQMSQQDPASQLALKNAQLTYDQKSGASPVPTTPLEDAQLNKLQHPDQQPMTQYEQSMIASRNLGVEPPSYKMNPDGTESFVKGGPADPDVMAAKNDSLANGSKNQDKLEQEFRGVVSKELSSRSGGMGLQDSKVNQALHLRALVDQYKQTDAQGNETYNIPTSQYHELAMGLASLISPGGQTSDADRQAINAHTAAGDMNGALQYITGSPQNGNTQAMTKNLIDSIDRQGTVAEQERNTYTKAIKDMAPTSLDPKRRDAIMGTGLNSYVNRAGAQPAQAADPLGQARAAIAKGAPRDAVIQRLKQSGIDTSGL